MFLYDSRWVGRHGIGRFAKEIMDRIIFDKFVKLKNKPTNAFDCVLILPQILLMNGHFFSPGYNAPLLFQRKAIITIHDLNHIDLPYNSGFLKKIYYKLILKRACMNCQCILTVSDFSRKRISEWSGVQEEKIFNVGNGVNASFNINVSPYRPGYSYLLCVSNRKLHKNESAILFSFKKTCLNNDLKLIFTGSINDEISEIISSLNISDRVVFIGDVDEKELPSLYRGAVCLVFPSLYEGFGLPVVEAMACGVPVLTSNTTSLPEVAGDAALLVNPESVDEISNGIERLVHNNCLREELIAKGLERAKLFSWDTVAARVQAVLDEVAKEHAK